MSREKDALRKRIRALQHEQLPTQEAYHAASRHLMGLLERHPRFLAAGTVALFWSLPDEPDTHGFLEHHWREKRFLLPVVTGETTMELRPYEGTENLQKGAFGILEPTGTFFDDFADIPLIVVPGVAFDRRGFRMGRGRGYYDRFLSQLPPFDGRKGTFRLGICFPFQLADQLPVDTWDLPVDEVLC